MYLHREGRTTILLGFLILTLSVVISYSLAIYFIFKVLIALPALLLFVLVLWFFRIPKRSPLLDDKMVIAPADGKVVVIEKTVETEYFKDERIQVSIFMSPLNVHQNVYPVSGSISYTKYHKGKYLVAWHPKSSIENERSTVVVKQENGTEILFRQIAGAVARRICTYSKEGESVRQGDEMGFIKFGSRVDIFLPLSAEVRCRINDTSQGKRTIIAEL